MNTNVNALSVLKNILWVLWRITILNITIILLAFILAFSRSILESSDLLIIKFPFRIYFTSFFLVNLVYIVGNIYETIYLRLWNKTIDLKDFEQKFFKAGFIMLGIVNVTGVILYLINYVA